ncbi:PIR protein CIR protein [Plasmodium vinckei vinckei]|uniref:PIR protein CIR protein n=1 Tax=Plasmodium vinckei vinckei TaxID=54757 RepID=A0A449BTC8_PLAVN|nr:PIR protein CIR protein [Plasmodium vinckei vinckei]VEV56653.1 PIR protein CIR protein [Plasmodium vinckei vinckei]
MPSLTQDPSQNTVQNGEPNLLQNHNTNIGTKISQVLTNSNTEPLNTGNGSTNPGSGIKMKEEISICCIITNKKWDIMSIGTITVSIFLMLLIMYKYLLYRWKNELKRKKT